MPLYFVYFEELPLISFANTQAGEAGFRLEQERARLLQAFGEATLKQLAENLDVSEEDVATATLRKPTSLTAPKGASENGRTLGDTIADGGVDVEGDVVQSTLMETVDEKMKAFASQLTDEREQIIWTKRLVNEDPVALAVLGKEFGVSRERVRQIEARLKTRLRNFLTQELGESLILDFTTED